MLGTRENAEFRVDRVMDTPKKEYLPKGTLLRSKSHHPNPYALAIIAEPPSGTDFQIVFWINGDNRSAIPYETISVHHRPKWFDVLSDEEKEEFLGKDFAFKSLKQWLKL